MLRYTYLSSHKPFRIEFHQGYANIISNREFTIYPGTDILFTGIEIWPTPGTCCILTNPDTVFDIHVFSKSYTWESENTIDINIHNYSNDNIKITLGTTIAKLVSFLSPNMGVMEGQYIKSPAT